MGLEKKQFWSEEESVSILIISLDIPVEENFRQYTSVQGVLSLQYFLCAWKSILHASNICSEHMVFYRLSN